MYTSEKTNKIFVSHSTQDIAFVQPLVELFEHIGLGTENVFCSSIPNYNVPLGNNIFDFLKEQFQNYNLRVIFMLSENYYNSPVCLNEMGAAWVLQHTYTSILLPRFDYKDVKGVINQMEISIKLDSEQYELKTRLNELREELVHEFALKSSLPIQNQWEMYRDQFIDKVTSVDGYWQEICQLKNQKRPLEEWISPLNKLIEANPVSYDAMYMLGTIYAKIYNTDKAIKYLKMAEKLSQDKDLKEKATEELVKLGYEI